jgi:hypothetical protein
VRRILPIIGLLGLLCVPAVAQGEDAVAVVVSMRGASLTSLDLSFPVQATAADVDRDIQELARQTGWAIGRRELSTSSRAVSCRLPLLQETNVQACLPDVVWPIVTALARHGRVGILIVGAPATVGTSRFENRYLVLEQSGGQGVQSYQATFKRSDFGTLAELTRPEPPTGRPGAADSRMTLAWMLLVAASLAIGAVVFWGTRSMRRDSKARPYRRRR